MLIEASLILSLEFPLEVLLLFKEKPIMAQIFEQIDGPLDIHFHHYHVSILIEDAYVWLIGSFRGLGNHIVSCYLGKVDERLVTGDLDIRLHMEPFDSKQHHSEVVESDVAVELSS